MQKDNRFQSYRTINQKDNIRIVGRYIKLPKLGFVKVRQSMEIGKIHHMTIEHTPSGKYFAVLNVKGMLRNHKLARSIASVSWAKFFKMLEYKAVWYGNEICRVPTMYPSSQTCSCCGCQNPLVKNLRIRIWECPECHVVHDRDMNAGINILKKGLQMQYA